MSKVTRITQLTRNPAQDVFRVSGLFDGKARLCWVSFHEPRLSFEFRSVVHMNEVIFVDVMDLQSSLYKDIIRINCAEKA